MDSEVFGGEILEQIPEVFSSSALLQSTIFRLISFTVLILVYSLFIFYSYKLFSRKNLFNFNFKEYLYSSHPTISSFFGFFVYLVEYIVVLPFFIVIWFGFYSIFLLVLAKNLEINTILLVCTALISAIRISSFTSQNLAQDLAKMLPFTLLALALTGERFFSLNLILERISEIPELLSLIPTYLIFIFLVEIIFRFFDAIKIFVFRE